MADCATILRDRDRDAKNGEDTTDLDRQLQACNLSRGTWNVDANGAQGALIINTLDTNGNVTGTLLGDTFSGSWDHANRLLTFDRPLQGVPLKQHYTGGYIPYVVPGTGVFLYTLAGLFTEDTVQGSFGWFAQTRNDPDSVKQPPRKDKEFKEKEKDAMGKGEGKEIETMDAGGGNGGGAGIPIAPNDQSFAQGRAFIRPEERPEVGRQVLQQPDQMQEENG